MKLLSIEADAKTSKNTKFGYITGIQYLIPHITNGFNACPMAEKAGCLHGCLQSAGRGVFNNVKKARRDRMELFLNDRDAYFNQLITEINALIKKADILKLKPAVRLNGISDIQFEKIKVLNTNKTIFDLFPNVQFYDYTKIPNRDDLPPNYDLTFSYSGVDGFDKYNQKAIKKGVRIAAVFRDVQSIPVKFIGRNVKGGDDHDLTFLHPKNTVLGLYAKGKAKKDYSGFVIN